MDIEPQDRPDLDVEKRRRQCDEAMSRGHCRTARDLALEGRRLGKEHRNVGLYILATKDFTWALYETLEYALAVDAYIELIGILESEDRARSIQSDVPREHLEFFAHTRLPSTYCGLANFTGKLRGNNSEGLYESLAEGAEICRRHGDAPYITMYRDVMSELYLAADDADMSLHFARQIRNIGDNDPYVQRRYFGAYCEFMVFLTAGDLKTAAEVGRDMLGYTETANWYQVGGRLESVCELEMVSLLSGSHPAFAAQYGELTRGLPDGQWPRLDCRWDVRDAMYASCGGNHEAAVRLLSPWDARLDPTALHFWFDVRLRLIAAHRLAGNHSAVKPLADELEAKARPARDWLTLRRLKRLLDPAEVPSPLAAVGPLTHGPFAGGRTLEFKIAGAEKPAPDAVETAEPGTQPAEPPEPASNPRLNELWARLNALTADDAGQQSALFADVLDLADDSIRSAADAESILCLAAGCLDPSVRGRRVWGWAEGLAAAYPTSPAVLSCLADLGGRLRAGDETLASVVTDARLESLHRQALDLDPDDQHNYARAGGFYFYRLRNLGEAERCLARGFRLNRLNSWLALRLAEVYHEQDRPRDALAVLDLSLRQGNEDPGVVWEAIRLATEVGQFDTLLLYADTFARLVPEVPWGPYYRALALVKLGRHEEAMAALGEFDRLGPSLPFPGLALRACAAKSLGRTDEYRAALEALLAIPLRTVEYVSYRTRYDLLGMAWAATVDVPDDDPLRRRLETRLLASGLAPEEYFEPIREQNPEAEGLSLYVCTLRQPLDGSWADSADRIPEHDAGWTAYHTAWGVLAASAEAAGEQALAWQARCHHLPAELLAAEPDDSGYTDRPGVIWQGRRSPPDQTDETGEAGAADDAEDTEGPTGS